MSWTDCPSSRSCEKCLDVVFDSGNDIACLNQKWLNNDCVYEGDFLKRKSSKIFVSSEQCLIDGRMDRIQVCDLFYKSFVIEFLGLNGLVLLDNQQMSTY